MANEAVKRYAASYAGDVVQDFTCADGATILKGTILKLTDARTAAASDGSGDKLAGIAAREKVANDGRTRLAVHRAGDFDVVASGGVAIGAPVMSLGVDNKVVDASTASGAAVLGYALEAATAGETFQVRVNL